MPLADSGPDWSTEQARRVDGERGTRAVILPLFSDLDDAPAVRTGPESLSPCGCIIRQGEDADIRRLIAMVRATLARSGK